MVTASMAGSVITYQWIGMLCLMPLSHQSLIHPISTRSLISSWNRMNPIWVYMVLVLILKIELVFGDFKNVLKCSKHSNCSTLNCCPQYHLASAEWAQFSGVEQWGVGRLQHGIGQYCTVAVPSYVEVNACLHQVLLFFVHLGRPWVDDTKMWSYDNHIIMYDKCTSSEYLLKWTRTHSIYRSGYAMCFSRALVWDKGITKEGSISFSI